ncbi:MAG: glycosyltransferase family 39 protein [Bacillota bacterium]|nr:glycosyltransferase family 39 protein [Bacillota bacterium]
MTDNHPKKKFSIISCAIVVVVGVWIFYSCNVFFSYYFIAVSIILIIVLINRIEDPVLRKIIYIALVIRLGLALLQTYTGIDLPGEGPGSDAINFENHGWKNAQYWLQGGEPGGMTGAHYYSAWIGILYYIFGRISLVPQIFNVYFSLLAIFLVYKTTNMIAKQRAARFAALFFMLIPSLNSFAAILLRETLIILFLTASFYFFVKWLYNGKILDIGGAFIAVALAGALHGVLFLLSAIYIIMLIFYSPREKRFRLVWTQLILAGVMVILAFVLLSNIISYQIPANVADVFTPEFIGTVVERKKVSRTSYLQGMVPQNYFDLIWQSPIRMIYFLFAPFPWMVENISDLFGFLDILIYVVLIVLSVKGSCLLWPGKKQVVSTAAVLVFSLVLMYSWGTTNYGTAWRHRQKLAAYLTIFAAVGVTRIHKLKGLFPEDDIIMKTRGQD